MNRVSNTMLLVAAVTALSAKADFVRECELNAVTDVLLTSAPLQAVDLRTVFPVEKLKEEPALKGLMYSALGFERGASADATRTAKITARAGALVNGIFAYDDSAEITVLPPTTGEGVVDWAETRISKKLYQLTHTVMKNGVAEGAILYGYFDFTHCVMEIATQEEVEAAVFGAITHPIAVRQDDDSPWQPIDTAEVRSGIATDEWLKPEDKTATTFTFKGHGVLHYEYDLSGGTLEVVADGVVVSTFAQEIAEWASCQVSFAGHGAHEVSFVYTASGDAMAAIRNVRWEEQDEDSRTAGAGAGIRVDLQEGVRTPKKFAQVLPFQYSSTNWIGNVIQVNAESVARVTIVQLTGTDSDVRNWTEEVPGTFRELVKKPGENAVNWRPKKGVWKATFDILNGEERIHQETAIFDLRNSNGVGLVLILT